MEMLVNENRGLTGKIAIVFGGSRGIGAAAARRLAREGADVAVTYVSAQEQAAKTVTAIEATRPLLGNPADASDLSMRIGWAVRLGSGNWANGTFGVRVWYVPQIWARQR
jgi:NAD(P)-dependent dehydrogenase (short-subunit alcohol dehydrogenase family)